MINLPKEYNWLLNIRVLPRMVSEGLKLLEQNTVEVVGPGNNPVIMQLAKEAGVDDIYKSDETAWCAVAQTAIALRAGKHVPFEKWDRLRAKSFLKFGNEVVIPVLGDTLVFIRPGGGHVGIYIAEDEKAYHVLGGNQGNRYSITRIAKNRLTGVRRPIYKSGLPISAISRLVAPGGSRLSSNEL